MNILVCLFFITTLYASVDGISENLSFLNGCKISNLKSEDVKAFPGNRCVFLSDGSFVSSSDKALRYLSKNQEVIWEISNLWFHHQLNLSADGQRLLVLGSEITDFKGKKVRSDVFQVIDVKSGREISRTTFVELMKQLKKEPKSSPSPGAKKNVGTEEEISHFNSFYEIPEISPKFKVPSYLKKGKFIINSKKNVGFFILTQDLQTVLHSAVFPQSVANYTHDAQVTDKGTYLVFNNLSKASTPAAPFSEINEIDPNNMKSVLTIRSNPGQFFFSIWCGGVQKLNDRYLFISHNYAGVFLYDMKLSKITYSGDSLMRTPEGMLPTQQVKLGDVTEFLKHHLPKSQ